MNRIIRMMIFLVLCLCNMVWAGNLHSPGGDVLQETRSMFGDALAGHVASGCSPTTSGTTTLAAFACNAYVQASGQLIYITQAAAAVGPLSGGNGTYWLAVHRDSSTAVGGWTRQTGTHYLWQLSATQPATPANGRLFAQITVAGGAITAVAEVGLRRISGTETVAVARTVGPTGIWLIEPGGAIVLSAALTFQGQLLAPPRQTLFSGASTISFVVNQNASSVLYPEWWGAIADNSTASGPAIQAMLAAGAEGTIYDFKNGTYRTATALTINKPGLIRGTGKGGITTGGTRILWTGGASILLTLQANARPFTIQDLTLDNSGTGTVALQLDCTTCQVLIRNIEIYGTTGWATAGIRSLTSGLITFVRFENLDIRAAGITSLAPVGLLLTNVQDVTCLSCYISGNLADAAIGTHVGVQLGSATEAATSVNFIGGKNEHWGIGIDAQQVRALTVSGHSFNPADAGVGAAHRAIRFRKVEGAGILQNFVDGGGLSTRAWNFNTAAAGDVGGLHFEGNRYQSIGTADVNGVFEFTGAALPNFTIGPEYFTDVTTQSLAKKLEVNTAIPNVGPGSRFQTANTIATTITDFEPTKTTAKTRDGKQILLEFQDTNTTVQLSTAGPLRGNSGVPFTGTAYDALLCTNMPNDTAWHCQVLARTPPAIVIANIATYLLQNGMTIYCSDCTIASPCAGGGTGAIAKRLNGANVCN